MGVWYRDDYMEHARRSLRIWHRGAAPLPKSPVPVLVPNTLAKYQALTGSLKPRPTDTVTMSRRGGRGGRGAVQEGAGGGRPRTAEHMALPDLGYATNITYSQLKKIIMFC